MIIGEVEDSKSRCRHAGIRCFIALICDILNDLISVTSGIARAIIAWLLHSIGCSTRPIVWLLSKAADGRGCLRGFVELAKPAFSDSVRGGQPEKPCSG
uniref:hypothetical protein n=1 Tax=Paracoccus sp. TRP TaxID=412597 RepID=UPI00110FC03F|nr:hypothetical protein [Paracoccus sp. TRP]